MPASCSAYAQLSAAANPPPPCGVPRDRSSIREAGVIVRSDREEKVLKSIIGAFEIAAVFMLLFIA